MLDKQLRSLSKTQMLQMLYNQEREIERLNAEKDGILQTMQVFADMYRTAIQSVDLEKKQLETRIAEQAEKLAMEKRDNVSRELEEKSKKLVTGVKRIITDLEAYFTDV